MTILRHIGNSQGVLIPKVLIEKANLEGHELELELRPDGLLIKPISKPRADWEAKIQECLRQQTHDIDTEWLDADLVQDDENEW